VVGGNAGGGLINDGLASGSSLPGSPEGGGGVSRRKGNGDRGARLERVWSCAARSSWARTGSVEQDTSGGDTETNDIGKATNGSAQRAERERAESRQKRQKKAKSVTTSADNTAVQRKGGDGSGNAGADGAGGSSSSDDSSNGGASSAGRDKGIGGGRASRVQGVPF
jgi:hypothetical protein